MAKSGFPEGDELARLLPDYKLDGLIGSGSTSVVHKATHGTTGCSVAIKIISLEDIGANMSYDIVEREITILKRLANPNVIQLYDVVYTQNYTCLVMEHASKGDFFDYVSVRVKLPEDEARPFFRQLILGVEYCHGMMVAHRDLKLENLLLDETLNLKLSDFGLSAIMNDDYMLERGCGSPHYAAPEVLSGETYHGPQVDVWSCGVILYAVITGEYPFEAADPAILFSKIKRGRFRFHDNMSSEVKKLISGMLNVNPQKRLTIAEITQHPWFQA
ncbi:hypothetical protein SOVF_159550 [Spinacia oleracea]|uniref:SNF1-related protein kinase catalytic subunit alpha KIN10 n=1 Tax=Spinacia oleracea TaxID=3562 RepID=A0A9R0J5M8_SPIOL|nr:SNF1-related protein kinase catalytic subunit alpha KIN10-like [Spinacia oleracea]XP_056687125.1 SNF1-related protein kinase catalytic subunit alpha KIN10-like [Spinacia oleracea]KNA08769.1 hypothetical protein SOVF_159550 [Spinacia oleracea]